MRRFLEINSIVILFVGLFAAVEGRTDAVAACFAAAAYLRAAIGPMR